MDDMQYELHKAIAHSDFERAIFHEKLTPDLIARIRGMLVHRTLPKVHWLDSAK